MDLRLLLRMSNLARNPPSWRKVMVVLGVIAACLLLFVIERYVGWPDALTSSRTGRPVIP